MLCVKGIERGQETDAIYIYTGVARVTNRLIGTDMHTHVYGMAWFMHTQVCGLAKYMWCLIHEWTDWHSTDMHKLTDILVWRKGGWCSPIAADRAARTTVTLTPRVTASQAVVNLPKFRLQVTMMTGNASEGGRYE